MNSLDLLDDEDGRRIGVPEQLDFLVEGAPASTANRTVVNISPRKAAERKPQARRGSGGVRRANQSRRVGNNNDDDVANGSMQSQMLQTELLEEVDRLRLELAHSHEEKRELENSFRRLDREIAEGFNLAERKEKELRIAELMTKNQKVCSLTYLSMVVAHILTVEWLESKLAEMLEKEHEKLEELRPANAELKRECERLESRVELLTRALSATEAKRNELESAHMSLTTSYSAAQDRMESLQGQVHEFQEKFVAAAETSGQFAEHEEKLRRWERKCRTLEQKLGEATERAEAQQQVATIAQNSAMLALSEKEQVETELGNAHDRLIQLTAKLRAVEAKLETDLQHRDASSDIALLRQRIRVLESELSERTRAYLEMKEAMSKMLGSGSRTVGSTRGSKPNTRLVVLTDKLRSAEDSRDRKGRVVAVLMQAIPFLMRQLDERTDQCQRAIESNAILKSTIEQFQASWATEAWPEGNLNASPPLSPLQFLQLAREDYAANAQIDQEHTGALDALSDYAAGPDRRTSQRSGNQHVAPFRVVLSTARSADNQTDDNADSPRVLVLAADSIDPGGDSYLSRSKINMFLRFIQGRAAKGKFKSLVIGKVAECLTKLRELSLLHNNETVSHHMTIQLLRREVDDLNQRLQQHQHTDDPVDAAAKSSDNDSIVGSRRKLLLKLIDLYAEKQHQDRRTTFVTQSESSDILISSNSAGDPATCEGDVLCLQNYRLSDGDVEQLLWKIVVSEATFVEIQLDCNDLTDVAAGHVADFLAKLPPMVQTVSLGGNRRISDRGVELIRIGMGRNPRVHRVDLDVSTSTLLALAALEDYSETGRPAVIFRVLVPDRGRSSVVGTANQDISGLLAALQDQGFQPKTSPVATRHNTSHAKRAISGNTSTRLAGAGTSRSGGGQKTKTFKMQQQAKLKVLEDALRKATAGTGTSTRSRSKQGTVVIPKRATTTPYTQSLSRRPQSNSSLGRTHVSIVRGLRRPI